MARIASAFLLTCFAFPAFPQEVAPPALEQRARQFEKECAQALPKGQKLESREEDWIQVIARDGNARVLLLDATKTRCFENHAPICGTGGCPVVVYRVEGKAVRKFYDQQVIGWRVREIDGRAVFHADVHGARCGLTGSAACETQIDLRTGLETTQQPE